MCDQCNRFADLTAEANRAIDAMAQVTCGNDGLRHTSWVAVVYSSYLDDTGDRVEAYDIYRSDLDMSEHEKIGMLNMGLDIARGVGGSKGPVCEIRE